MSFFIFVVPVVPLVQLVVSPWYVRSTALSPVRFTVTLFIPRYLAVEEVFPPS